jgi:uncharacterized protein YndB with AHSA1/START domain
MNRYDSGMHIDIAKHVGAVGREVSARTIDGKSVRVVTLSRSYATTPEDLWEAVTTAERIPRWFMPVTGDLKLGGRYQLQGNAGGEIVECDPPRHFKVTWEFAGNTSWVDVRVAKDGAGARLQLEHSLPEDEHWKKFGPGATGVGWDMGLVGLTLHMETGAPQIPEEGMKWMMSDNGKDYVRATSEAWYRAAVASGEDAGAAKAAAAQTTAAYTGS